MVVVVERGKDEVAMGMLAVVVVAKGVVVNVVAGAT